MTSCGHKYGEAPECMECWKRWNTEPYDTKREDYWMKVALYGTFILIFFLALCGRL